MTESQTSGTTVPENIGWRQKDFLPLRWHKSGASLVANKRLQVLRDVMVDSRKAPILESGK